MPEGKIYFISDTHLGDGTDADHLRFPDHLAELLNRIEADQGAELVLLGDFMELWGASMEAVMVHHAPLFLTLARIAQTHPITYVVGNHDSLPWYYYLGEAIGPVSVTERFTALRGQLVALHGHQYDPFNRIQITDDGQVKVPWTRKLVGLMASLERLGGEKGGETISDIGDAVSNAAVRLDVLLPLVDSQHRSILTRLKSVLERQSPGERGYPPGERLYEEAATGLMRTGARFVLMGHTHHPLARTFGNRRYLNTGSWVSEQYPPTYARYAHGELELLSGIDHRPWQESKPFAANTD